MLEPYFQAMDAAGGREGGLLKTEFRNPTTERRPKSEA